MRRWLLVVLLPLMAGCASTGVKPPDGEQSQAERRAEILARDNWALRGRIAVSDGRDGGSARVNWEAGPQSYELWIYAPLAQGTWRLTGKPGEVELAGPEGTFRGNDAEALLSRHLGWHIPVTGLRHWVRGIKAPGPVTTMAFDGRGRLAVLEQDGWRVTYTDWTDNPGLSMPRRIEAEYPPYQVKLVVQDWALKRPKALGERR